MRSEFSDARVLADDGSVLIENAHGWIDHQAPRDDLESWDGQLTSSEPNVHKLVDEAGATLECPGGVSGRIIFSQMIDRYTCQFQGTRPLSR